MVLFLGLDHVNIRAADLEKAVQFYTGVLGFSLVNRLQLGPVKLVFLSLGTAVIELREEKNPPACRDGLVDHLALRVADIFAAVRLLKERGVELLMPEPVEIGPNHYYFFFRGPSGEKIELMQN